MAHQRDISNQNGAKAGRTPITIYFHFPCRDPVNKSGKTGEPREIERLEHINIDSANPPFNVYNDLIIN